MVLQQDLRQALQSARAQGYTPQAAAKAALDQAREFERGGPDAEACIRQSAIDPGRAIADLRSGAFDFNNIGPHGAMNKTCAKAYVLYYYGVLANREAALGMACHAAAARP